MENYVKTKIFRHCKDSNITGSQAWVISFSGKALKVFTLFMEHRISFKVPNSRYSVVPPDYPVDITAVDTTYSFPPIFHNSNNNMFGKFFTIYNEPNPDRIIKILKSVGTEGGWAPPWDCVVRNDAGDDAIGGLSARYTINGPTDNGYSRKFLMWTNENGSVAYSSEKQSKLKPGQTLESAIRSGIVKMVKAPEYNSWYALRMHWVPDHLMKYFYEKEYRPIDLEDRLGMMATRECLCAPNFALEFSIMKNLSCPDKEVLKIHLTAAPTSSPTSSPLLHLQTRSTTSSSTLEPAVRPTSSPTRQPTSSPTSSSTLEPAVRPTSSPTHQPTSSPTSSSNRRNRKRNSSPRLGDRKRMRIEPTHEPTSSPTSSSNRRNEKRNSSPRLGDRKNEDRTNT